MSDADQWLKEGEKFALIGMSVNSDVLESALTGVEITSRLRFQMPDVWQGWLGSIRVEEIRGCNVFIVARSDGSPAGVLDGENQRLFRQVFNTYIGLLLTKQVAPSHAPVRLSGGRTREEFDLREQGNMDWPLSGIVTHHPKITTADATMALALGEVLTNFSDPEKTGKYWRLIRTVSIFLETCSVRILLDRIHDYCRCLEGLIATRPGKGREQFQKKSQLFIGSHHNEMMGQLYDIRSAVEHLREEDYAHQLTRERALFVVKGEAMLGYIVRSALTRILLSPLLRSHFYTRESVLAFWELNEAERRAIWGDPINPSEVLRDFHEDYVNDSALGLTA